MALPLKIKIRWGYVIAFLMLLISYFLIFFIIRKVATEAKRVSHSYAVINNLESIKAEITDAETGIRGYVITKDVRFLQPYNSGSKSVLILYNTLRNLVADNTSYKELVDSLGFLIKKRLNYLSDGLNKFQIGGNVITDSMKSNREASKQAMDGIRSLVHQLQEREFAIMKGRSDKLKGFFNSTKVIAITSLIVALFTIIYSVIIYTRENKAKEKSDKKVIAYSRELEEGVKELKKVNIELQELKSIEKFAATGRIARTIAHEVRNPLTNISLAAEQLKEQINQSDETVLLLDMVSRNATRINQLVSDLLNSTRFAQLEYAAANINQILDEALEQAKDRIELKQIKVEKFYEKGLGEIQVDKEKIKLAFLNIIVNAIEAMEKGAGLLQLRTLKTGDKCIVEIKDNGTGMDEESLQKLFEPYFTSKMKGNGLGLTNTQNIILNHKGNISVKSKPGEGSIFTIMLNKNIEIKE
jgi:signal transduction histidine kinase